VTAPMLRYTFEDSDGNEFGSFSTTDLDAARVYAMAYRVRVVENTYTWSDSDVIEDYTEDSAASR
jgi:hypothetical protein